jgi:hypothetical protein
MVGPCGLEPADLVRVNAGISSAHDNFNGCWGTAKYLIIPRSRTYLGLAFGLKNETRSASLLGAAGAESIWAGVPVKRGR